MLRRTINPEVRVIDEKTGIVEYVASDETIDSYREVIKADGWRFDEFKKNAPFVDSHDYSTLANLLGRVVDFRVEQKRLIETVKWAVDVPENALAQLGFNMTKAGYLKAVSVGFVPTQYATKWDADTKAWKSALQACGRKEDDGVACIYLEQQQKELSACVIGANPNALARGYKAGVLTDADLDLLSIERAKRITVNPADSPAAAALTRQRARMAFLVGLTTKIKSI